MKQVLLKKSLQLTSIWSPKFENFWVGLEHVHIIAFCYSKHESCSTLQAIAIAFHIITWISQPLISLQNSHTISLCFHNYWVGLQNIRIMQNVNTHD